MRYLLDTNIVTAILNRRSERAIGQLAALRAEVGLPSVVMHELSFGAYNSVNPVANLRTVHALELPVLDLTGADAIQGGCVRAALKALGTPIGHYDLLIAGQALGRGLTLVTNNTRDARVRACRRSQAGGLDGGLTARAYLPSAIRSCSPANFCA